MTGFLSPTRGRGSPPRPVPHDAISGVVLPIPNVRQQSNNACALAVAQMIIRAVTGEAPSQRELAIAAGVGWNLPMHRQHVERILLRFATRSLVAHTVTSADGLRRSLVDGTPIILIMQVSPHEGHVMHATLLKGVLGDGTTATALINDPVLTTGYSLCVPVEQIQRTCREMWVPVPTA